MALLSFKSLFSGTLAEKFWRNQSGAFAPIAGLAAVVMIGAVGLGIDTLRQQNALSELQHVTTLVCDQTAGVSTANYPTAEDRAILGDNFKTAMLNRGYKEKSSLDDRATEVNITFNNTGSDKNVFDKVYVNSTSSIEATFMQILGYSTLELRARAECPVPDKDTSKKIAGQSCTPEDMNFTQVTNETGVADTFSSTLKNFIDTTTTVPYLINVYNVDTTTTPVKYTILSTAIVLPNADVSSIRFHPNITIRKDNHIVLQKFNIDGSTPVPCLPTIDAYCSDTDTTCNDSFAPPTPLPACAVNLLNTYKSRWDVVTNPLKNNGFIYAWDNTTGLVQPDKLKAAITVAGLPPGDNIDGNGTSKYAHFSDWGGTNLDKLPKLHVSPEGSTFWNPYDDDKKGGYNYTNNGKLIYLLKFYYVLANAIGRTYGATVTGDVGETKNNFGTGYQGNMQLFFIKSDSEGYWYKGNNCLYIHSPIALDLTGRGRIETTGDTTAPNLMRSYIGKTIAFDMSGNGRPVQTEWLTGNGQGLLVDNRDGKAATNMSGRRLFGDGEGFGNGYEKLARLDTSHTGVLKGHDLDGLAVWIDDGDGIVQPGELKTLAELGVTEISAAPMVVDGKRGEKFVRSWAVRNGMPIMTEDVWFAQTPILTGQK